MKKLLKGLAVFALVIFLAACSGDAGGDKKDGYYQAANNQNGEWTNFMTFEVKDGKIDSVDYNSVNLRKGEVALKKEQAKDGKYVMNGKSGKEWHEQAKLVEDYIIEHQNLDGIKFDDEGNDADGVTGATIHIADTKKLLDDALEAGPVEKGDMKDGIYYDKAKADEKGYVYTLGYYVKDGHILAVTADAFGTKGDEKDKFKSDLAKDGKYDLGEDAVGSYDKQAIAFDDYLIKNQGLPDLKLDKEGKTDAISGATITVKPWVDLYDKLSKESK